MTNEEQIALGRRAVACKGWKWLSGMLTLDGYRCIYATEDQREWASPAWIEEGMNVHQTRLTMPKDLPDMTDAATLGCVLELLKNTYGREIYAQPLFAYWHGHAVHIAGPRKGRRVKPGGWGVYNCALADLPVGDTQPEALICALEVAP